MCVCVWGGGGGKSCAEYCIIDHNGICTILGYEVPKRIFSVIWWDATLLQTMLQTSQTKLFKNLHIQCCLSIMLLHVTANYVESPWTLFHRKVYLSRAFHVVNIYHLDFSVSFLENE